ncbi:transcriptional regulator [Bowdeniella massiliensis]|uniref:transcriptional regulator n=1 Tax=Bowdeniella massiliensis TaxID=2932264 RepID=UPI002028EE25|nr:transcriptional regulator [Bowdeniella massiliensis]
MTAKKKRRRVVVESRVDRELREAGERGEASSSTSPVLPRYSESESDRAWGDSEDSNDARLLENLPPHWGRG